MGQDIKLSGNPRLHLALLGLIVILGAVSLWTRPVLDWEFALPDVVLGQPGEQGEFRTVLDRISDKKTMHSPAILRGDEPAIIWFEGSREAARDVQIMSVTLEGAQYEPGPVRVLLSPENMSAAMSPPQVVLVLGNTIQGGPGNMDNLLATVVSAGGWAAASIAKVTLENGVPGYARKLALSPLLNRSYLVRNSVIRFSGGDIGVPGYFEMGNGFGELIRLAPDGRVRGKARIGRGALAIQPAIVVTGPRTAIALMRPFGPVRAVYRAATFDGGKNWTQPEPVADLPNPGAPVAALNIGAGRILMAFNDSAEVADSLSLAVSDDDGLSWKRLVQIETPGREKRSIYRYPDLARLPDGSYLLTYSILGKRGIRAHVFNQAWLDSHE